MALGGPLGEWGERFFAPTCSGPSSAHGWLERVPNKPTACGPSQTWAGGEWITAGDSSVTGDFLRRIIDPAAF